MLKIREKTVTVLIVSIIASLTLVNITTHIIPGIRNNPSITSPKGIKLLRTIFIEIFRLTQNKKSKLCLAPYIIGSTSDERMFKKCFKILC
jgi:hypothetical protein